MKIDADHVALGGWCTIPHPLTFEVMARSGFDWLCLDLQHTFIDLGVAMSCLQASAVAGVETFVRTASHDPAELMHMLDAGATGVLAPIVNTAEQARAIVAACKYPPQGWRSWGPVRAALSYDHYTTSQANRDTQVGVMIETLEGMANLPGIVATPGLDMVFVGPNDLALALGVTPRHGIASREHGEAIAKIAETTLAAGLIPAIQGGDAAGSRQFIDLGYQAVFVATDLALVGDGARLAITQCRGPQPIL